ncbi:uncharacterized protein [Amphiura filiformis]|uniref:uncharacterized protein n=1 Tax=Amphiura filiformis TaxID=82378 RepID=UPI003B20D2C5
MDLAIAQKYQLPVELVWFNRQNYEAEVVISSRICDSDDDSHAGGLGDLPRDHCSSHGSGASPTRQEYELEITVNSSENLQVEILSDNLLHLEVETQSRSEQDADRTRVFSVTGTTEGETNLNMDSNISSSQIWLALHQHSLRHQHSIPRGCHNRQASQVTTTRYSSTGQRSQ